MTSQKNRGFTLIEFIFAMSLFLVVILAAFEFLSQNKKIFLRLKEKQEAEQAVMIALDRIKIDLLQAGCGLWPEASQGFIQPISVNNNTLYIIQAEIILKLAEDAPAGAKSLNLTTSPGLSSGRDLILLDGKNAELNTVASSSRRVLNLTRPISRPLSARTARISVLYKVTYYLDNQAYILRRKVNSSSAQPLLEKVKEANFGYEQASNLAAAGLTLIYRSELKHEIKIFPKNLAFQRTN